nr:glycosyltransferase family 2 protein [uncultured Bacteroides sp.]
MKLSVVIVNYNVKHFLELCLCSLYRAIDQLPVEVFVVDNASLDGSLEYLMPRFPKVNFISNNENVGFACANNQAIALAKGEYILLLNPDTVLGENTITDCLQYMENNPDVGGAGVKMLTGDGSFLPESKRGFPTPMVSLYKLTGISKLFPNSHRFGKYHLRYLDEDECHSVDVLAGAFMFLRKSALDKCGLLDEDFFMYGEDIDLSYRITKAGYKNCYLPFPVIHYKGESTKKDSIKYVRVFYEAMMIFFRKHYPHYSIFFACVVKSGIYLRALLAVLNRISLKLFSYTGKKALSAGPCFLVLGSEEMISEVQELCLRNGLKGKHRYEVVNEELYPDGHLNIQRADNEFTHIVYDREAYSLKKIIQLISTTQGRRVELGIYSVQTGVLVTPQNCYK